MSLRPIALVVVALCVVGVGYSYFSKGKSADATSQGQFTTLNQVMGVSNSQTGVVTAPKISSFTREAISNVDNPALNTLSSIAQPDINAKAWMVLDVTSGQVLGQLNAHQRISPASLTKLMTASLVFSALNQGRINLDQKVTVSEKAWRTGGSRMFIEVGKQVSVGDLIQGMIVQSGNDATMQLAELVGGSEDVFVNQMNQRAKAFGMSETHFTDPTGLPAADHYTSVRDLAILAQHIIHDYPEYYHYFGEKSFTYNKITQQNRNGLLFRNMGVDGLKTGHTDDAGYCLISTALREGRRVLSVMVGAKTSRERESFSQNLLEWGFQNFSDKEVAKPGQALVSARVWEGKQKEVGLGSEQSIQVTVPRGQAQNVQILTQYDKKLMAPLTKGQVVGNVQFVLNGKILKQTPLVVLENIPQAGFLGRMWDKFLSLF